MSPTNKLREVSNQKNKVRFRGESSDSKIIHQIRHTRTEHIRESSNKRHSIRPEQAEAMAERTSSKPMSKGPESKTARKSSKNSNNLQNDNSASHLPNATSGDRQYSIVSANGEVTSPLNFKSVIHHSTVLRERKGILKRNGSKPSVSPSKRSDSSRKTVLSREVHMRLYGNYDKDRKICSCHQHDTHSFRIEDPVLVAPMAIKLKSKRKPLMVDTAQSPGSLRSPSVNEDSIEEVDLQQFAREVKEAACDPIGFEEEEKVEEKLPVPVISTETQTIEPEKKVPMHMQTQTIEPEVIEPLDMHTQTEEPELDPVPSPLKDQKFEASDWCKSGLYKLVNDIRQLPPENRLKQAKLLEAEFINHGALGILTEEEASYTSSLLRKRCESEEPFNEDYLDELFLKAKKTVEVLAGYLQLNRAKYEDDDIFAQL